MAGAIMSKVWDLLGMEAGTEEEIENDNVYSYNYEKEEETDTEEETDIKSFFNISRKGKVVSMPTPQQVRMVITQPTSFEQSEEICNYLKERKSII